MKRFIAGAICPECRIIDRIVVEMHEGMRRRRCVSCGYVDSLASGTTIAPSTRFSRRAATGDERASPVKIIDPTPRDR